MLEKSTVNPIITSNIPIDITPNAVRNNMIRNVKKSIPKFFGDARFAKLFSIEDWICLVRSDKPSLTEDCPTAEIDGMNNSIHTDTIDIKTIFVFFDNMIT